MVDLIDSTDALMLVSRSDQAFVQKCIDWARSVEGRQAESLKRENDAIRKAVSDAARVEAKGKPFHLSGRGHEPRVTLDRRLASILRGENIPCIYISGYGAKSRYPRRIFKNAAKLLKKRLGATPIVISQRSAYRVNIT